MNANEMRYADPNASHISDELDLLEELLPLEGANILELGAGGAEKTRFVAEKAASVLALEVDEHQLAKYKVTEFPSNIRFDYGGAEKIPADDASQDIVLMFMSLHHVPIDKMDDAFSEIHRVLKPGGLLYVSEPVYDGPLEDVYKLFHDEKVVREAAFEAEKRAVSSGRFKLLEQRFFSKPVGYKDFKEFEEKGINVWYNNYTLTPEILEQVRIEFEQHMTPEGAHFLPPQRIDLFQV